MGGNYSKTKTPTPPPVKPKPTISAIDRTTLDLKNARDRLQKYTKQLEKEEIRLLEKVKLAKSKGQTQVALQLLKLKKMKRNELDATSNQLFNVLQMVQTIDSKQNETQVLAAMKKGKDALQVMHEATTVDDILNLMDTIQEQNQLEQEMSDILAGVPTTLSVTDEAEIEQELEALMMSDETMTTKTETKMETLPEAPTTKPMPVAPSGELVGETENSAVAVPS